LKGELDEFEKLLHRRSEPKKKLAEKLIVKILDKYKGVNISNVLRIF